MGKLNNNLQFPSCLQKILVNSLANEHKMKRLTTSTKLLYGLGFASQGIKDGLFQLFLFFYYSQILGLDAAMTGAATLIALVFDAVSDPLVGILSDRWKSVKWGRRHPFMFASALPLGLSLYFLFLPPEGISPSGLFWWLTIFTILVRIALTLFIVPAMSLGAELSTDYEERTSITSYRIMFGAFISSFIIILGYATYFKSTPEFENGLFNTAGYPKFAMLCGILTIIAVLISTWSTKKFIPTLPKASDSQKRATLLETISHISTAFKMLSYRTLVGFIMIIYIGFGVGTTFTTYFTTYFFELSTEQMGGLVLASALGSVLSLFITPTIGKKMDKKWGSFWSTILFGFFFSLPFNLRILGLFPENGSDSLLLYYCICVTLAYLFLWTTMSLANSMMADVVDEYELQTQNREEGLFFSTMSFAYKMTVGFGYFFAGLLLNWIQFPKQAAISDIPAEAIQGLGWVGGPILLISYLASIGFIAFYPITAERYHSIRKALDD